MRLTPDVQDALLSEMESRARPPFIEDSVALTNEAVRMELAERFGKYRFVIEFKSEILNRRSKK